MEGEEHDRAVGEVRDEVVVLAGRNGSVQEGCGTLSSRSFYPVVVPQLRRVAGSFVVSNAAFELQISLALSLSLFLSSSLFLSLLYKFD